MQAEFRRHKEDTEHDGVEYKPPPIPFFSAGKKILNEIRPLDKYQIVCVAREISAKWYFLANA